MSLQGSVQLLERGSATWEQGRQTYLERFPHAEMTFGLGDFSLWSLRPERGRWVTGFAGAVNLTPKNLAELAAAAAEAGD